MSGGSWFHVRLQVIRRSEGRSAVACAAYRIGGRMLNLFWEAEHDYTRKRDVLHAFTLLPDGLETWEWDAEVLWNAAEQREARKNSQIAYEWLIALPHSLDDEERFGIAQAFSRWLVANYGVGVTTGVHGGGRNGRNDHMHVMMTTRAIGPDGWHSHKMRTFSIKPGMTNPEVTKVREQVATIINCALADAGEEERVNHRRIERRLRPPVTGRRQTELGTRKGYNRTAEKPGNHLRSSTG